MITIALPFYQPKYQSIAKQAKMIRLNGNVFAKVAKHCCAKFNLHMEQVF